MAAGGACVCVCVLCESESESEDAGLVTGCGYAAQAVRQQQHEAVGMFSIDDYRDLLDGPDIMDDEGQADETEKGLALDPARAQQPTPQPRTRMQHSCQSRHPGAW